MTALGLRLYDDKFEKRIDPRGNVYYWLVGEAIDEGEAEGTDAWAILHNKISVTPIAFNMTDHVGLKKLQGLEELTSLFSKVSLSKQAGSLRSKKDHLEDKR